MPDALLDLNLQQVNAVIRGYNERQFDFEKLAVSIGYWTGYYQSKKPQSPADIIRKMWRSRSKVDSSATGTAKKDLDVDVAIEEFMRREQLFQSQQTKRGG